jgi:hypothetical protein
VAPAQNFAPELLLMAQSVRAAIFDVDGVLTDGRLYIGEHGETCKAFHALDGQGSSCWRRGITRWSSVGAIASVASSLPTSASRAALGSPTSSAAEPLLLQLDCGTSR